MVMKKVSLLNCASNLKTVRMQSKALIPGTILRAAVACVALVGWSSLAMAQAGSLDVTFANNGLFTMTATSPLQLAAAAVALQSDGKIVMAGTLNIEPGQCRVTSTGTLESSGGNGGIVNDLPVGGHGTGSDEACGVAIKPDG
jgi:hypothetical protein